MKFDLKRVLSETKAYTIISIGMLIYSFSWVGVLIPSQVMGGGISGVGMLIYYATDGAISVGYSYFAINALLIGIGMAIIGPRFGVKTFYAMIFNSVALVVLQEVVPADILGLADDKLLSAILGGAMCGLGVAICFGQGGSTGGTDIIAMVVNKYREITIGKVIMLCDVLIVGCSFIVFEDITSIIYGYVTMATTGYTIDLIMQGNQQTCQIMIFSKEYEKIADRIVVEMHRGVTLLDATGWYTKQPNKVMMVLCRKQESPRILHIVKEIDTKAFISSSLTSGVYGEGFDTLKTKIKQKNVSK